MNSRDTMCERCDGLCCRVYDIFDHETGKHVKRAGDKCGYLDIHNRCRIHATRKQHLGYRDSCEIYDCMEGGPIVTVFSRRLGDHEHRSSILSSLLEVIRLKVIELPNDRNAILQLSANLLNEVRIDDSLLLSIKIVRVKIERYSLDNSLS